MLCSNAEINRWSPQALGQWTSTWEGAIVVSSTIEYRCLPALFSEIQIMIWFTWETEHGIFPQLCLPINRCGISRWKWEISIIHKIIFPLEFSFYAATISLRCDRSFKFIINHNYRRYVSNRRRNEDETCAILSIRPRSRWPFATPYERFLSADNTMRISNERNKNKTISTERNDARWRHLTSLNLRTCARLPVFCVEGVNSSNSEII